MPNTYYNSALTGEQIENALEAIHGVVTPSNNGKVLTIENGGIVAKSASEFTDAPVLETLNATANGDYVPESGVDGFNSVHVAVPGAGNIQPLSVTQNGTYTTPSGVDGYSPVTVNVSGGGLDALVGQLFHHIVLSNQISDKASRGDRYFVRTSSEPVIFMSAAFLSADGPAQYTGYSAISFSSEGVSGTSSSYGNLTSLTHKQTPNGTDFYTQVMNGMYPPSTDNGVIRITFGSNTNNEFELLPSRLQLMINASTMEFIGDQPLIETLYEFIDAVYAKYYSGGDP